MVKYRLVYTRQALKDARKIGSSKLAPKAKGLLEILKLDPFREPPEYKSLIGDLSGTFSRRINHQHRLVYQVYEEEKVVKIIRMWIHYGE